MVNQRSVFFVGAGVVSARGVLQLGDDLGGPHVLFAARSNGVFAARVEKFCEHWIVAESELMQAHLLFGNLKNANAFNAAASAGKVLIEERGIKANRLKYLRTAIALIG